MTRPIAVAGFLASFLPRLDGAIAIAGADPMPSIHYEEMAKPVQPLDPKKAIDLATAFFRKKFPNNPALYFAQKIDNGTKVIQMPIAGRSPFSSNRATAFLSATHFTRFFW
jgi:hypothetical protein